MVQERINEVVRDIPDFPKPGIMFKDITPIFKDPKLCADIVNALAKPYLGMGIDVVAGIESRGFLFGPALAIALGAKFIPVRKPGKLPYHVIKQEYDLEYGTDTIEIHIDAIGSGEKVLIHDDILATGGTAAACAELVYKAGGEVKGFSFIADLAFLNGKDKLPKAALIDALTSF